MCTYFMYLILLMLRCTCETLDCLLNYLMLSVQFGYISTIIAFRKNILIVTIALESQLNFQRLSVYCHMYILFVLLRVNSLLLSIFIKRFFNNMLGEFSILMPC